MSNSSSSSSNASLERDSTIFWRSARAWSLSCGVMLILLHAISRQKVFKVWKTHIRTFASGKLSFRRSSSKRSLFAMIVLIFVQDGCSSLNLSNIHMRLSTHSRTRTATHTISVSWSLPRALHRLACEFLRAYTWRRFPRIQERHPCLNAWTHLRAVFLENLRQREYGSLYLENKFHVLNQCSVLDMQHKAMYPGHSEAPLQG